MPNFYDEFYGDEFVDPYYDPDYDKPMSDAQVLERLKFAYPNRDKFSLDTFLSADPALRGLFADAYTEAEGDPISTYATLNDQRYQRALVDALAPQYEAMTGRSTRPSFGNPFRAIRGRQEVQDYGNAALENLFSAAAPTNARNMGYIDFASQYFGGRPYPGGVMPQTGGPGFGGGGVQQFMAQRQAERDLGIVESFREKYGKSPSEFLASRGKNKKGR